MSGMLTPRRPAPAADDAGLLPRGLTWVALLAWLVSCGVPLGLGVAGGWAAPRVLGYVVLALVYLALLQRHLLPAGLARLLYGNLGVYVALTGLVCLLLQISSGDPYLQPIVFTVPLVHLAVSASPRRTALVAVLFLALMAFGLRVAAPPYAEALAFPLVGYGMLMVLIYSFTQLLLGQASARQRADLLAADLARERDYLARLVEINAALTRDLDLDAVLAQVAAAGRTLARSGEARVWLRAAPSAAEQEPALRLAVAVPAGAATPAGPPAISHTVATGESLILPLTARGALIGVLELRERPGEPFSAEDVRLLRPLADSAAVAIENARLYEQAGLSATLAERNRLARELHDTIAQGLTAVGMQLEAALRSFERHPERTRSRLSRANDLAHQALEDVRRSVWTLAAPLVDGAALPRALEEAALRFAQRTGLAAHYTHTGATPNLDHAGATQVLRIVQEALQNVEKHARATAVTVGSDGDGQALRVWVRDDGAGFDPATLSHDASPDAGFGLFSLRERARLAGGTLEISSAPGVGTEVTVLVPLSQPGDDADQERASL